MGRWSAQSLPWPIPILIQMGAYEPPAYALPVDSHVELRSRLPVSRPLRLGTIRTGPEVTRRKTLDNFYYALDSVEGGA